MSFLLTGGGNMGESKKVDRFILGIVNNPPKILYIPLALDEKKYPYPKCLKWIKKAFPTGNIDMLIEINEKSTEKLNDYDIIYIGGGNTFKLINSLTKNNFLNKLVEYAKNRKKVIYGVSAGAIIFGKTLKPALYFDSNEIGIENFEAINKIDNYEIWVHYESKMDDKIFEYMEKNKVEKIIALPENVGLFKDKNNFKIIGGEAYLFKNSKKEKFKPFL